MSVSGYKSSLRRSFGIASESYDLCADLHRKVAHRLSSELQKVKRPQTVVDIGCGTGILTSFLAQLRPGRIIALDISKEMCRKTVSKLKGTANVCAVVGDAEKLPIDSDSVQISASSYALQWARDLDAALGECVRITQTGGLIAIAVPVSGSMPELAGAVRSVLGAQGLEMLHTFPDPELIRGYLADSGVREIHQSLKIDKMTAPSAREIFRSLRLLGVQTAGRLGWRVAPSNALRILKAYEGLVSDLSPVSASFRTFTYIGKKETR